jgi:hypothetical protein
MLYAMTCCPGYETMRLSKPVHPAWYAILIVLLAAVLVPLGHAFLTDFGHKPSRAAPNAVKRAAHMGRKPERTWLDRTVTIDVGEFRAKSPGHCYIEGSAPAHALAKAIEANPQVARIEICYTNIFPSGNVYENTWTYDRANWSLEWRTNGKLASWYYTDMSDGLLLQAIRKLKPSYGLADLGLTARYYHNGRRVRW